MWLFTSLGMLSVVQAATDKNTLVVRSREAGVIERLFPAAEVVQTVGRDYLYRTRLPRAEVAQFVADYVMNIGYGNFKDSIPMAREGYHNACFKVWQNMADIQPIAPYSTVARQAHGKGRKPRRPFSGTATLAYGEDQ